MSTKRRQFTDAFKAKVALEAIRGVKSLAELTTEYQVHPSQITQWKKLILSESPALFSGNKPNSSKNEEELTAPLYEEIGRLKMDIKWLKKNL
jgi:transposase-like protein